MVLVINAEVNDDRRVLHAFEMKVSIIVTRGMICLAGDLFNDIWVNEAGRWRQV